MSQVNEKSLEKKKKVCIFPFLLSIENVSVDNVLRQLGVDPYAMQQSPGIINSPSNIGTYVTCSG